MTQSLTVPARSGRSLTVPTRSGRSLTVPAHAAMARSETDHSLCAQVLEAKEVELAWATGRQYTVEVYAPATQEGEVAAQVASTEWHTIVVVAQDGNRRAYDLYAIAWNPEQLASMTTVYERLLTSSHRPVTPTN